mmetsp:Transcript_44171/g.106432  ORF Transcript_44171/g.106432 Transcript_44171/m.106432 type:complete len:165 (-) Transcript_44171:90-584(-)
MKTSIILTLLTTTVCFQDSAAFVDVVAPACAMPMESLVAPGSILGGAFAPSLPIAESPIVSSSLELANTMAVQFNSAAVAASNPAVESEVLADVAHVALDFSGIFRPSKYTMRLYSIGGRLLGLLADYLPDHTIHTEEVLIQLFFIFMTGQEILQDDPDLFQTA